MKTPVPENEAARLETVGRYKISVGALEAVFDDLVLVASGLFRCPIAFLSLVDADRVRLRSRVGLSIPDFPRDGSFDAHAILQTGVLVVKDSHMDPRFAAQPGVRFYAGIPLVTADGHAIGTLAVLDRKPREIAAEEETSLRSLARLAMGHIELHRKALEAERAGASAAVEPEGRELEMALTYADGVVETARGPLLILDGDLIIVKGNRALYTALQRTADDTDKRAISDVWPAVSPILADILSGKGPRENVDVDLCGRQVKVNARLVDFEGGGVPLVVVGIERRGERPATPPVEGLATVALDEMQEPANRVATYSQLLSLRYGDKLDADAKRFIEEITFASFKMQDVIKDFLQKVRTPAAAPSPLPATGGGGLIDTGSIVDEFFVRMQPVVRQAGGRVTRDSLPSVKGSADDLRQVFKTLLENSVKFRSQEPPVVHVWAEAEGADWVFAVSDNGVGIDPRQSEAIFEKRTLGRCREIIDRQGGRIWVMSQAGNGATFYFTLPKQASSA